MITHAMAGWLRACVGWLVVVLAILLLCCVYVYSCGRTRQPELISQAVDRPTGRPCLVLVIVILLAAIDTLAMA